jgi:hypothetical protein
VSDPEIVKGKLLANLTMAFLTDDFHGFQPPLMTTDHRPQTTSDDGRPQALVSVYRVGIRENYFKDFTSPVSI